MIKSIQYTCLGTEGNDIYFHPCSGNVIIDVLVDGYSFLHVAEETSGGYRAVVDNHYGKVTLSAITAGMLVQVIYKTLPRFETVTMELTDFDIDDFDSGDFA